MAENTRSAMAQIAATQCRIWSLAAGARFDSTLKSLRQARVTEDDHLRVLGEAMMGVIAFELALEAARWVVANREEAAALLGDVAGDLDILWWTVKARRDKFAHTRNWVKGAGQVDILVGRQSLLMTGLPPFHLVAGLTWSGRLEQMVVGLDLAVRDERPSVEPPRIDPNEMPAWSR